jgi:plastocyanin
MRSTTDTTTRRRRFTVATTAATALSLVGAAGCGSDAPSADADAVGAPEAATIEVTTIDYAYVGLPTEVAAGTGVTLVNDSETEVHEFVAVRLADDEERSVADLVQLPPDEFGALLADVETVIVAPPMGDGLVVEGTGLLAEPGRYAVLCVIPTGADPDEYLAAAAQADGGPPDVAGGPPHIVEGMFAELTVTG